MFDSLLIRRLTQIRVAIAAIAAIVALMPLRAPAQSVGQQHGESYRRHSVDVTVGSSAVRGGRARYVNDAGLAADVLVGLARPGRYGLMYAASVGVRSDVGQNCSIELSSAPPYPCLPKAPTLRHLGVAAGYEFRRSGSSIRALLGPALFADGHRAGAGGRMHVSAAVGAPRVAVTAGVNGHWLALSNGTSLRYYTSAFGIRLQ